MEGLRGAVLQWLADSVDTLVKDMFAAYPDLASQPPPALRLRTQAGAKRQYTSVSAEAAWDLMQRARTSKVAVPKAV